MNLFEPIRRLFARSARNVSASYDAARTTRNTETYWQFADRLSADAAHNPQVRQTLVSRSRYEVASNPFADGIASTICNDTINTGPTLQMETLSEGFNALIEAEWRAWAHEINLRQKLWILAHAKLTDGEGFALIQSNERLASPVKLSLALVETEQCASRWDAQIDPQRTDGIVFDDFGEPLFYEFLRNHPGDTRGGFDPQPVRVPAELVCHWVKLRRPGQHRGVPEMASSLNSGAWGKRFREAYVTAAERNADQPVFLETKYQPYEQDKVEREQIPLVKGAMVVLPNTVEAKHAPHAFPDFAYRDYHLANVGEMGRPKSVPANKAAADSSNYNYASGRLDHQQYFEELVLDRLLGNEQVLDVIFPVWMGELIRARGLLGGDPRQVAPLRHRWNWPRHKAADVVADATANEIRLKSGQVHLGRLLEDQGLDWNDEFAKEAEVLGITVEELQRLKRAELYPSAGSGTPPRPAAGGSSAESNNGAGDPMPIGASARWN